jgi:hypothetical protein
MKSQSGVKIKRNSLDYKAKLLSIEKSIRHLV